MEKKPMKVSVEIYGETYALRTDSDPEYLKKLAAMVDKHMKDVAKRSRSFDNKRITVLAALELADEYCKLKKDYDDLLEFFEK